MTERERLTELIIDSVLFHRTAHYNNVRPYAAELACYLLDNGVIVPPCKVGDKVYEVIYDCVPKKWQITEDTIAEVGTKGFFVNWDGSYEFMPYSEIDKSAFLTREEAEKALKEREK